MHARDLRRLLDRQQRQLTRRAALRQPVGDQIRQPIDRRRPQLVQRPRIQRHRRPRREHLDRRLLRAAPSCRVILERQLPAAVPRVDDLAPPEHGSCRPRIRRPGITPSRYSRSTSAPGNPEPLADLLRRQVRLPSRSSSHLRLPTSNPLPAPSCRPQRSAPKLLAREPPPLTSTRRAALRQPRVPERPVAGARERVPLVLDRLAVPPRPTPRITPPTPMQPLQDMLVPRPPQRAERRRVAAALREAVPAEPERVRPPPQPQRPQMRLRRELPRTPHHPPHVRPHPQVLHVARRQPVRRGRPPARCSSSRTWRCTPRTRAASSGDRPRSRTSTWRPHRTCSTLAGRPLARLGDGGTRMLGRSTDRLGEQLAGELRRAAARRARLDPSAARRRAERRCGSAGCRGADTRRPSRTTPAPACAAAAREIPNRRASSRGIRIAVRRHSSGASAFQITARS